VFELTPIVVIAPILPDRLRHVKRARDRPCQSQWGGPLQGRLDRKPREPDGLGATIDPDALKHYRVERW